uniref:Uncharacterized protein n=1 Tax=Anguilla anguilla TaxID=7936 RepID=A0A0E9W1L2_ANGAN
MIVNHLVFDVSTSGRKRLFELPLVYLMRGTVLDVQRLAGLHLSVKIVHFCPGSCIP